MKMKAKNQTLQLLLAALLGKSAAFSSVAQEPAKQTVAPKTEASGNPLTALNDRGVAFSFSYTGEILGNLSGGYKQGAIYEGLLKIGVQLDLEKLTGWKGATIVVSGLYPHGSSLSENYLHDFNTLSNIDAFDTARLYEAWFQQDFDDGKFSFRIGQILADADFFISSGASLFVSSAFGVLPTVSKNTNPPIFPVAAPGARMRYAPNDSLSALLGVFDGNVGDPATTNKHGTRFDLNSRDGLMFIGEIACTLNPPQKCSCPDGKNQVSKDRPLTGTYKLGGFYQTANFDDLGGGAQHRGDYGFYVIADQEIWHEPGDPDQGLKVFGRVGAAPDDRNTVSFYCDGGLNYQGLIPARDKDISGIGVSYTKISDNFLDASGADVPSHHEAIIEATYLAQINTWLSLQPDFQYIVNPGATGTQQNSVVAGVRFNICF
jgi:porin